MSKSVIVVMDGLGIGAAPDARLYGDEGSDTLGHLASAGGGLNLPCLESLGLGNLGDFQGISPSPAPLASFGRMEELSKGKDTITGHWEMMGIVNEKPFPTYPEGFPGEIIAEFERRTGRKVLWNKPASGTEIIRRLGNEHMRTGRPIVYTSADSVFQIAAHEDVISVQELYRMCRVAREILAPPHNVCRVIARPFIGPPFTRTYRRRDFPLPPPEDTVLDLVKARGVQVLSVGKVGDMFDARGFTTFIKAGGNQDIMKKVAEASLSLEEGLIFSNLVDFDTLYGHRNDVAGFKRALEEFDAWLSYFIPLLGDDDYLLLAADHGNDPTTASTDHSREYVPILLYNRKLRPRGLGTRRGFLDIGATVADLFGVEFKKGRSLLEG